MENTNSLCFAAAEFGHAEIFHDSDSFSERLKKLLVEKNSEQASNTS